MHFTQPLRRGWYIDVSTDVSTIFLSFDGFSSGYAFERSSQTNTIAHENRLPLQDSNEQRGLMLRYSEKAVRLTEDISINLGFCALLLTPTFLLAYVQNKNWKLAVVTVFVLLSTFLSSFMATATHKPGLAIVAG